MNTENAQYLYLYVFKHTCMLTFFLRLSSYFRRFLFSFLRLFTGRLFNQCRAGEGLSKLLAHTKESVHFPTTNCLSRFSISDWVFIVTVRKYGSKFANNVNEKMLFVAAILPLQLRFLTATSHCAPILSSHVYVNDRLPL